MTDLLSVYLEQVISKSLYSYQSQNSLIELERKEEAVFKLNASNFSLLFPFIMLQ